MKREKQEDEKKKKKRKNHGIKKTNTCTNHTQARFQCDFPIDMILVSLFGYLFVFYMNI